jgi:hypothetical protein
MRQGRESGCGRGSKSSWGEWVGDVVGLLGVRACVGQRRFVGKAKLTGLAHGAEAMTPMRRGRRTEREWGAREVNLR